MNPRLLKLKPWLTLAQAAQHLSDIMDDTLTEADVLSLGLEGHLKLSLRLPPGTVADCWDLPEERDIGLGYWEDLRQPDVTQPRQIGGVWDLPMFPPTTLEVESLSNEYSHLPRLSVDGMGGALVERPHTTPTNDPYGLADETPAIRCRLRVEKAGSSSPASLLPAGSEIVVRSAALSEFTSAVLCSAAKSSAVADAEPDSKQWQSVAKITYALASLAQVDVTDPPKAATQILKAAEKLGIDIVKNTIVTHLKRITDYVEPPDPKK